MYELTNNQIDSIFKKIAKAIGPNLTKNKSYTGQRARHSGVTGHFDRGHECGITPEKIAYDDGHSLYVSLNHYQRRTRFERESLDRTPKENIDFCRRWFWYDLLQFIKNPVQVDFLFSAIDNGIKAGKTRRQITIEEYRARKYDLPNQTIGTQFVDRIKQIPLYEYFLSFRVFFATDTTRRIKND